MDVQKIAVKLFLERTDVASVACVPVFHGWIQRAAFADHMLIDVADYAHVSAGPGAVLVSDEANIHLDDDNHEPGLLYIRKRSLEGDLTTRLIKIAGYACQAALQLEADERLAGKFKFATNRVSVRFNDRLLAPNNGETLAAARPALDALAQRLWPGDTVEVKPEALAERLAGVDLVSSGSQGLQAMRERLG